MTKRLGKVTSACHYQSEAATTVSSSSTEWEPVKLWSSLCHLGQSFTIWDGGGPDGCKIAIQVWQEFNSVLSHTSPYARDWIWSTPFPLLIMVFVKIFHSLNHLWRTTLHHCINYAFADYLYLSLVTWETPNEYFKENESIRFSIEEISLSVCFPVSMTEVRPNKNDAYTKTMFNVNCPLDRTCQGGSGHAYEVLSWLC